MSKRRLKLAFPYLQAIAQTEALQRLFCKWKNRTAPCRWGRTSFKRNMPQSSLGRYVSIQARTRQYVVQEDSREQADNSFYRVAHELHKPIIWGDNTSNVRQTHRRGKLAASLLTTSCPRSTAHRLYVRYLLLT